MEDGIRAGLARTALLGALEQENVCLPALDAQVQRAIHLARSQRVERETLGRLETISCCLARMHHALRQGRVNAHASALLRIRRVAEGL